MREPLDELPRSGRAVEAQLDLVAQDPLVDGPPDVGGVRGPRVEVRVLRQQERADVRAGRVGLGGVGLRGGEAGQHVGPRPAQFLARLRVDPPEEVAFQQVHVAQPESPVVHGHEDLAAVLLVEGPDADEAHAVEQPSDEGHQGLAAQHLGELPVDLPAPVVEVSHRDVGVIGQGEPLETVPIGDQGVEQLRAGQLLGAADLEAPPAVPRRVGERLQLVGVDPLSWSSSSCRR